MKASLYVCYWYDGDDYHLTRCEIDENGKPLGLPENGDCMLIIEYDEGHEPIFYDEATVSEFGIDNAF